MRYAREGHDVISRCNSDRINQHECPLIAAKGGLLFVEAALTVLGGVVHKQTAGQLATRLGAIIATSLTSEGLSLVRI